MDGDRQKAVGRRSAQIEFAVDMTHEFLLYVMFNVNARNTKLDQNGMLRVLVQELNTFDVLSTQKSPRICSSRWD